MNMKEQLELQAAYDRGDFTAHEAKVAMHSASETKRRGRPPKPKPEDDE